MPVFAVFSSCTAFRAVSSPFASWTWLRLRCGILTGVVRYFYPSSIATNTTGVPCGVKIIPTAAGAAVFAVSSSC